MILENPEPFRVEPQGDEQIIEPFNFVNTKNDRSSLVVLNQKFDGVDFKHLWHNTSVHICADGGANQLYDHWESEVERSQFIPDFIVGDLDSLTQDVRKYYESKGTRVIAQYTQYASDFMKSMTLTMLYFSGICIGEVDEKDGLSELAQGLYQKPQEPIHTYILNGLGGRFDQSIHSINQIINLRAKYPNLKAIFINPIDIVFLLNKGRNLIKYESVSSFYKGESFPVLGMLPFTPCRINSYGLRWDVRDWESSLDGQVSSSNGVMGIDGVVIECDGDLVVNVEYDHSS